MLARTALCFALFLCPAALAEDIYYEIQVSVHADVYIGIYADDRITWNALPLPSRVALEAKLLLASQQKPKPFFAVVSHSAGKPKSTLMMNLLRTHHFRYVLVSARPSTD